MLKKAMCLIVFIVSTVLFLSLGASGLWTALIAVSMTAFTFCYMSIVEWDQKRVKRRLQQMVDRI
jgi:positive regulator of sigma E activity